MSGTPTSYDAQHCEKIRRRMTSCLESVQRRVQRQNERRESLQKEATAAGFACIEDFKNHKRDTDPRKCRIAYEKYKKCLSEDENNRFCVQRRVQRQNERRESLQKEATAAGFACTEDYKNHKRDTDPRKCRIAYEKYKKSLIRLTSRCLSEDENNRFCQFYINNCPQFK
ncbi:unnamed protein product [Camellia sinensis]